MECVLDTIPYHHADLAEELELVQLTPAPRTSKRSTIQYGDLRLHHHDFYNASILRGKPQPGRLILGWFRERTGGVTLGGNTVGANHLFAILDDGVDICSWGNAHFDWIEIDWSRHVPELAGLSLRTPGTSVAIGEALALRPLESAIDGEAAAESDIGSELKRFFNSVAGSFQTTASTKRYEAVRAAEEFMWRHVDEPMSVARIASAISRSERTVVSLFHSTFGMGPIAYFKARRLNAVRRELMRASLSRRIIDVAADFSFWHMGHFGADYRRLFGETPSDTRRRSQQ